MTTKNATHNNVKDKPMNDIGFKYMSYFMRFRDMIRPPRKLLQKAGVAPGFRVLDFGCGPGSFTLAAAQLVGEAGTVYALDIHSLAVQNVRAQVAQKGLGNVEIIQSDCETGLPDDHIDIVLIYDVLHNLSQPNRVIAEAHRVLKPGGVLSVIERFWRQERTIATITSDGLFSLRHKGKLIYRFTAV